MQKTDETTHDPRFAIVRALARSALSSPNDAVAQQVRRLVEAYARDGFAKEAKALRDILEESTEATAFAPSRLIRSRAAMPGEELTARTPLPVDRETAVPLVDVLFATSLPNESPAFDADVEAGVFSLIHEWAHWDALRALGIQPTRSCLIYGAPGTGKTKLALWLAGQLGFPIVLARLDGLISSFLGTTSRNIGSLFQFANRYRCVLLLDEFDAIAKLRDDPQEVGEIKRVVNTLLQNLDGRRELGITIGITNHEQLLDAAIWRRFDVQLAVPRPKFATRLEIARRYIEPLPMSPVQLGVLAWLTDGLSGAEIEAIARSVKKSAAIEAADFDFVSVLRRLSTLHAGRIPPSKRDALKQDNPDLATTLYNDADFHVEQKDLADLFDRDRATVSRWLKEKASHLA